ncbi:unnamed protein product [Rotaria sordida]|uniref:Hint domain-containing protein n=1 Tax=Rotaria sordida TaxID=392033 RepID=A0A815KS86_9BILA|nr:unnamed protein product [Rotaria sordida]CAF1384395.1 unnamed protein product [Rotaria sordida]CAF1396990.1 unnamed protein product [Rotaria sordida]
MTPGHFVPILGRNGMRTYVQAQKLTKADYIFVQSTATSRLRPSKIASITIEAKLGYYSPLTTTGTLIVNNIAVSCYSNIISHEIGQFGMAPIRWIHAIVRYLMPRIKAPFQDDSLNKVHWIPDIMQTLAKTLVPQILTNY